MKKNNKNKITPFPKSLKTIEKGIDDFLKTIHASSNKILKQYLKDKEEK